MHITRQQFEQIGAVAAKARQLLQELGSGLPVTIAINRVALGTVEIAEQLEQWSTEAQQTRHPLAGLTIAELQALPKLPRHILTALNVAYYDFYRAIVGQHPHAYPYYPSQLVKHLQLIVQDEVRYQTYPQTGRWEHLLDLANEASAAFQAGYRASEEALRARYDEVRSLDHRPHAWRDQAMAASWEAESPNGKQTEDSQKARKHWYEQGFCEAWDESDVLDLARETEEEDDEETLL